MMTLEKNYKIIFFVEKNEAQISGFAVAKKSPKSFKKQFFEKNFFQLICADMIQNGVQNFFLNKWVSRYLSFGDFKVPKNCSSL